jgi:hypothetical protein
MVSFKGLMLKDRAILDLEALLKPQSTKEKEYIKMFVENIIQTAREFAAEDQKWKAISEIPEAENELNVSD